MPSVCLAHGYFRLPWRRSAGLRALWDAPRATGAAPDPSGACRSALRRRLLPSMYVIRLASCCAPRAACCSASTFCGDRGRREVVHALERESTLRLPSPVSVLGTWNATRGFIAFRRSSKLSTSISRNLRSATGGQRLGGVARQVGHHAHDERELDLLLGAVKLDVVFDLHTRGAVAGDELLAAHVENWLLRAVSPSVNMTVAGFLIAVVSGAASS